MHIIKINNMKLPDFTSDYINSLRMGNPFFEGNILFVPLHSNNTGDSFNLLDDSIDAGTLLIEDSNEVGSVLLSYNSRNPLFVMDGEEIIGARQNRIFNTSFTVENEDKLSVPVTCVEEGRWSGGKNFSTGRICAHPAIRAITSASITKNLSTNHSFMSDQSSVWKEVRKTLMKTKTHSKTLSMHEAFESSRELFDVDFVPGNDVVGIIGYTGKGPLAIDIFYSPALFKKLSKKLIKSYLFGTIGIRGRFPKIDGFFDKLRGNREWEKFNGIGDGVEYRTIGDKITGKVLVKENKTLHISFFSLK